MPKQKGGNPSATVQKLFPVSAPPQYPTAEQILAFLSRSRITDTQLRIEHVESLLNVLVLDGEIERVSVLICPCTIGDPDWVCRCPRLAARCGGYPTMILMRQTRAMLVGNSIRANTSANGGVRATIRMSHRVAINVASGVAR